jgi:hypothetical protein
MSPLRARHHQIKAHVPVRMFSSRFRAEHKGRRRFARSPLPRMRPAADILPAIHDGMHLD